MRISPLEKLYSETLQELDKLGRNVDKSLRDFLSDAYTGNYRQNIFDLVKTGGLDVSIAKVDSHDVSRVLASRWSGKNFSKRVWNNTTLLSRNIRSVITDGVLRLGIEYYQFMAVLDNRTSQRCRALNGEVFLLEERDVGANYPPMHARCRSTVAPFIEGVATTGKRVARDIKGRNIEISATMTYEDYESVYIRKEKSLSTWKKEHPEPKVKYKVLAAI